MPSLKAVIDANILFPRYLRDTVLYAALEGLFAPVWTEEIVDEVTRNLVRLGHVTQPQAEALRLAWLTYFPGAWVEVSASSLTAAQTRDPGDRHVLAAAIEEGASVIVTQNVDDFPEECLVPHGVIARRADEFLLDLYAADPTGLVQSVRRQQAAYRNPVMPMDMLLAHLGKVVPRTVAALRLAGC